MPVLFPKWRFNALSSLRRKICVLALSCALIGSACTTPVRSVLRVESPAKPTPKARPAPHPRPRCGPDCKKWLRALFLHRYLEALAAQAAQAEKACGGNLPPCYVCERESHCTWTAFNDGGCGGRNCYGKWQFDPMTWDVLARQMGRWDLIGNYFPKNPADQNAVAAFAWNGGRGCSHWAACG